MAVFKCKMCGGDLEVVEGNTTCECEYCGTLQTLPSLDNEKKLNLFNRANRLRFNNEFDKAAAVYESIVAEFPEEAEAYWGLCLCKYGIEYVDDPTTAKKIPTCHRTSYDSIFNDSNFEMALEYADMVAQRVYREEAKEIDRLQQSILEIAKNEKPYDIFICYKETAEDGQRTKDSVLAQDMYDALTAKGYKVFFSRITLEDKLGQEYEPYIFSALNSAKIMLAVGTKYEYYNAVWVKNEWSRFLDMMNKDKSKVLIPCYADIDAYDMPQEFRNLQGQDMGKVGFMQDLVRGIGKIIPKELATPAVNNAIAPVSSNAQNLLKRGFESLEQKKWEDADKFFERVLDENLECGDAYLGKLLALNKWSNTSVSDDDVCNAYVSNYFSSDYISIINNMLKYGSEETYAFAMRLKEKPSVSDLASALIEASVKMPVMINDQKYMFKLVDQMDWNYKLNQCAAIISDNDNKGVSLSSLGFKDEEIKVTSIALPEGVTSIKDCALESVKNLENTELFIPESLKDFSYLGGIKKVKLGKNQNFIFVDGALYSTDRKKLYSANSAMIKNGTAVVPEEVKEIKAAFTNNDKIESVILPEKLDKIGSYSFLFCSDLKSIKIPNSVTSIGIGAFDGCTSLTSVVIPDSVTSIGGMAFYQCTSLTSVVIPDSVTSIDDLAFCRCKSLTSVVIPDSVTSIGNHAFSTCISLTSVVIPDSVTSIGYMAFYQCTSLTSVVIPDSVTSIGEATFAYCRSLTSVVIPDSVTSIGESAFSFCESLTSVVIPDRVTSIGESAFGSCKSLTSVVIPDSVTSIGESAFSSCDSLTSIVIPDSVTSIGESAFESCESLTSVVIPDSVTSIGESAFEFCKSLTSVVIPDRFTRNDIKKWGIPETTKILTHSENAELRRREEQRRKEEEERRQKQAQMAKYRSEGVCQYCGGEFKGLLFKSCSACGKKKDY